MDKMGFPEHNQRDPFRVARSARDDLCYSSASSPLTNGISDKKRVL